MNIETNNSLSLSREVYLDTFRYGRLLYQRPKDSNNTNHWIAMDPLVHAWFPTTLWHWFQWHNSAPALVSGRWTKQNNFRVHSLVLPSPCLGIRMGWWRHWVIDELWRHWAIDVLWRRWAIDALWRQWTTVALWRHWTTAALWRHWMNNSRVWCHGPPWHRQAKIVFSDLRDFGLWIGLFGTLDASIGRKQSKLVWNLSHFLHKILLLFCLLINYSIYIRYLFIFLSIYLFAYIFIHLFTY